MLAGVLARLVPDDLDRAELALLRRVPRLVEALLLLRLLRLCLRHDATPLVVLQVRLGQTTTGVVRRTVHNLRARPDCMLVTTAFHVLF